jgi:hypothetical protein
MRKAGGTPSDRDVIEAWKQAVREIGAPGEPVKRLETEADAAPTVRR